MDIEVTFPEEVAAPVEEDSELIEKIVGPLIWWVLYSITMVSILLMTIDLTLLWYEAVKDATLATLLVGVLAFVWLNLTKKLNGKVRMFGLVTLLVGAAVFASSMMMNRPAGEPIPGCISGAALQPGEYC